MNLQNKYGSSCHRGRKKTRKEHSVREAKKGQRFEKAGGVSNPECHSRGLVVIEKGTIGLKRKEVVDYLGKKLFQWAVDSGQWRWGVWWPPDLSGLMSKKLIQ